MQTEGDCRSFAWVDPELNRHYKAEVNNLINEIARHRENHQVATLKQQLKEEKDKYVADLDAAVDRVVDLEEQLAKERKIAARHKLTKHILLCLVVVMFVCRYIV